jgi:predicted GNAT family acetyltransferase
MTTRDADPATASIGQATVRHDELAGFYEVLVDGHSAGLLVYGLEGQRRVFTHVFINEDFRGNSLSTLLVRAALDDIRATGGTVTNYCPVVGHFVDKYTDYATLIDPKHPGRWRRSKEDLSPDLH